MHLPDYHGASLVNLMSSITRALGGAAVDYPPSTVLPAAALDHRVVVLLVIDGMGYAHLERMAGGGLLHAHLAGRMTSVFPSTTASAITTFLTGTAPQQHALTGWYVHLKEVGCVTAVLPLRPRYGGPSLVEAGVDPRALFDHANLFDRLAVPCHVVAPREIVHSPFNLAHTGNAFRHGYANREQMFECIVKCACTDEARTYVYAYYPELDRIAHEYGIYSPEAQAEIAELDAAFGVFAQRLAGQDAVVVATADHGFVDVDHDSVIDLADHPDLADTLVLPLCGERRAAYCYVHPDRRAAFEAYVTAHLSDCLDLFPSADLVAQGWFGLGLADRRLHARIGDYTLVMRSNYVIKDRVSGERDFTQIGVHGGVSAEEMYVPLIVMAP